MGDKWPIESFSVNMFGKSGLLPSSRQHFPPPFVLFPFPSPEISLLLCPLCPLLPLSHASETSAATASLLSIAPLSTAPLSSLCSNGSLDGDKQRWERRASHRVDLGPAGSPWPKIYESDRGLNLISCSGSKSDSPQYSRLYFPSTKKSPLGTGWSSRFPYTDILMGESPTYWIWKTVQE